MNIKHLFSFLISSVLLVSCLDLYTHSNEPDDSVVQAYSMYTFVSPDNNGLYLIDPRPVYKNMIYHFDLKEEVWSAFASRDQLPVKGHYDIMKIITASIVNNKVIIIYNNSNFYSTQGNMYEYDLNEKKLKSYNFVWPDLYQPSYFSQYDSSYNISALVYNRFSQQLYYISDSTLYLMDNNYEFQKKCTLSLGNLAVFFPRFEFISEDTLVTLASEYPKHQDLDPLEKSKKMVIYKTHIHHQIRKTYRHHYLDSLNARNINLSYFSDGSVVTFDYEYNPQVNTLNTAIMTEINCFANRYRNLTGFDNSVNTALNPFNITKWADIDYQQFTSINILKTDGHIYLFDNDKGYVLYNNENTWKRLPNPDFVKLNQKP